MNDVFTTYLPAAAVTYCRQLWQHYNFDFYVVNPRRTRLGDFRVLPNGQTQITVNANLNKYAFLITYVHEVAHAEVERTRRMQRGNRRVPPHGDAWRKAFQQLIQPLLTDIVFPRNILLPLEQYMCKPAATTYAHPALMLALRQADVHSSESVNPNRLLLRDITEGDTFIFDKKKFVRGTLRRTRIVCKEVASGKSYAILSHAWVEKI